MTQDEIGNILIKMQQQDQERDKILLNVQNTLINMQQEQKERDKKVDERLNKMDERFDGIDERLNKMDERFDGIDERLNKMDERFDGIDETLKNIVNDVSENVTFMQEYFTKIVGSKNVNKFQSKSHMQILENHEDRISVLESKIVANQ